MKDSIQMALVVGVLLIGGFYLAGVFDKTPVENGKSDVVCESSTTAAVTFRLVDAYQTGTNNAGYIEVRRVGSTAWTSVASGSSTNFSPYDEIEILGDYNFTIGYASHVAKYTVPCAGTALVELKSADKNTANITGTFWNAAGSASTVQPMTIGDTKNVKFQFVGNYRRDYGNTEIGYNIMNCVANKTEIQDLAIPELTIADKPSMIEGTTGFTDYTFEVPVFASNAETLQYIATIVASDVIEPIADIRCTVYDTNYYVDSITGIVGTGIQNNTKGNVGSVEPAVMAFVDLDLS